MKGFQVYIFNIELTERSIKYIGLTSYIFPNTGF